MNHWKQIESSHYIFHCKEKSFAHKNITQIMEEQERRFKEITDYFTIFPAERIDYFLCDSREEVGELTDGIPCNATFWYEDENPEKVSIYAVYNEEMQCTGYHEETHAITHLINEPSSAALAEGIAAFMEKTWWGVAIELCTYIYLREGRYISVERLICGDAGSEEDYFYEVDSTLAYPIMGAFVSFLLSCEEQGRAKFLQLYSYQGNDWREAFRGIYHCELRELELEFVKHIRQLEYTEEDVAFGKARLGDE